MNRTHENTHSERPPRKGIWPRLFVGFLLLAGLLMAVYVWSDSTEQQVDPDLIDPVEITKGDDRREPEENSDTATGEMNEPLPGILAGISEEAVRSAAHPLDPLLNVARLAREKLLTEVRDYSAVLMNEIRTPAGQLRAPQFLKIKIRHPREEGGVQIPFSVYSKFLEPKELAGQEVIWVEGKNDGQLIAHPPKFNVKRFYLDPTGPLAMGDNRHPIYEMGLERLLAQIIAKGERDREVGTCDVTLDADVAVNDVRCLKITVSHSRPQPPLDFHQAKIYVDIERQIPIGYEGFDWPDQEGGEPKLIERYFYSKIEFNNGFTDKDWDPNNREYKFPRF